MTRNRLSKVKQAAPTKILSTSKAHTLFLEDNDNIEIKDFYKIQYVQPPTEDAGNRECLDKQLFILF